MTPLSPAETWFYLGTLIAAWGAATWACLRYQRLREDLAWQTVCGHGIPLTLSCAICASLVPDPWGEFVDWRERFPLDDEGESMPGGAA